MPRSPTQSPQATQADTRLAKLVLAIFSVATPLWWAVLHGQYEEVYDPLWLRMVVPVLSVTALISSVRQPQVERSLPAAVTTIGAIAAMHGVALAWWNPDHTAYTWQLVTTIATVGIVVRDLDHVRWFWTATAGATAFALFSEPVLPPALPFLGATGVVLFALHLLVAAREEWMQDHLSERTNLLREVFENATDALFLVDPITQRTLLANQRAADMFGVDQRQRLLDQDMFGLQARAITEEEQAEMWETVEAGGEWRNEVPYHTGDGGTFWGEAAWRIIDVGPGRYALVRISPIDARKAVQDALEDARDAAESATRAKSNFLASMSHEIRTPLNGVLGLASLLEGTPLDDEQQSYVQTILASGRSLRSLIDELLDFSRIEAGELVIFEEPVVLSRFIDDLELLFRPQVDDKALMLEIELGHEVPARVRTDGKRVQQVLINLLGNAVKFTAEGTVALSVHATWDEEEVPSLIFEVRDTGIGIEPADLPDLFEPFSQGDPGITRRYGGTGLGLAISKTIAERMGGTLTAASIPGEGSTFRFVIPVKALAPTPTSPGITQPTEVPLDGARKVLVCEDNQVNRMVVVRMLGQLGCSVDTAENGYEAVQAARDGDYDVIFMDVMMPDLDGLQATMRVRALRLDKRPWVVALTASVLPGDRARCKEAGMDDFVPKPIQIDDVKRALRRAVQSRMAAPMA